MSSMSETRTKPNATSKSKGRSKRKRKSTPTALTVVLGVAVVAGLFAVFTSSQSATPTNAAAAGATDARYPYAVGEPAVGEQAPEFTLPSTSGDTVALDGFRGQSVLLYFQEGLMCQPCWDQLKDIEGNREAFTALGIDEIVSVTHDPLDALRQKVELEGITSPVLSDGDLSVSKTYETNKYGMMGGSTNGHSFILVGPDGEIQWRADYGGDPKYTMYVPVDVLLADMEAGLDRG